MISPGSSRAISADSEIRSHSADAEFAGRDIDPGQREARLFAGGREPRACDGKQIIVAPRVEQRVFGERSGRDEPHDIAMHHAFGAALARLGRILELLAHRDAMAERDQPVQIFVGADRPARRTSGCPGRDACRAW